MNFYDIRQNTEEWFDLRSGVITGSKIGCIMAHVGKSFGEVAKKYAINLAIEQITGNKIESDYTNRHMIRGHEQEPLAIALYEEYNFCEVKKGGFFSDGVLGCSPDGLVEDDGIIEVKSVIPTVHFANIKRQGVDPAYKWQVYFNLYASNRKWIDYISYCDNYATNKKIFIHRLYKEDLKNEFEEMKERINDFIVYVENQKEIILNSKIDNY